MRLPKVEMLFDALGLDRQMIDMKQRWSFVPCPFEEKHQKNTGYKHSRLYYDFFPWFQCFHRSCYEDRSELNAQLCLHVLKFLPSYTVRNFMIAKRKGMPYIPPEAPSDNAKKVEKNRAELIAKYGRYAPKLAIIPITPIEFLSRLFELEEGVWIGQPNHSGYPQMAIHFRTLAQWQSVKFRIPWEFTAGCTFPPGCYQRTMAKALKRKYLILESDTLSKEDQLAMCGWLRKHLKLDLVAVVWSGGKSFHFWFKAKDEAWILGNTRVLTAAGFDPTGIPIGHPMRLGGQQRLKDPSITQNVMWMKKDK